MSDSRILGDATRSPYDAQLEQCRDLVSNFISTRLPELFEQADTALVEFAGRAEDSAVQQRFIAAIAQLERRRSDMEHIFHEELNAGFQGFGTAESDTSDSGEGPNPDVAPGIELSLVELDDMEASVATENLIARANADYFPDLYAISQRLSVVARGRKLKDHEIPGAPHHLVHSFGLALDGLDVEVKVKVVLYALLDKVVVRQCGSLYEEYSAILKSAGILPKLKPAYIRSPESRAKAAARTGESSPPEATSAHNPPAAPAEDGAPADLGTELFHSILDLMAAHRPDGQRGGGSRHRSPARPEVAAAAKAEILAALSQAQARTAAEVSVPGSLAAPGGTTAAAGITGSVAGLGAYADMELDANALDRVRMALTHDRQQILEQIKAEDLSPVDANVIDLIGMLFEYMLNDPVLPNAAKALLSHLHTPYLKVALLDHRVLEDSGHPARRLLDEMVEAGSLLIDEKNLTKGIFPVMQQTVDRVLQEFTEGVEIFDELLEGFRKTVEEQQRRTDTVEQRAQAAARGREKLQLAKQHASQHIQSVAARHPIPEALSTFLTTTWLDQLVLILLREKDASESTAWHRAVATAEELVAIFDPGATSADRRARFDRIPELRQSVLGEVQRMGSYSRATIDALGSLLDNPQAWKPLEVSRPAETPETGVKPAPSAPGAPRERSQTAATTAEPLSDPQKTMIEKLRQMRVGTWLELSPQQGGTPRRVKLSWVSPLTSTCMFVDRVGTQAETKSLTELADDMLSGRAKVIPRPKHPFIERALISIRKLLQGEGGETTEPVTD